MFPFQSPNMFSSQHSDEFLAHNSSILHPDIFPIDNTDVLVTVNTPQKRGRKSNSGIQYDDSGDQLCKKLAHKETERQRRQEMAGLYASLRSLLPPEYIRGKRSISDHMQEAVSYIKKMETSIEELRIRSENLKKNSRNGRWNDASCPKRCVMVSSCGGGIEILVNCGVKEGMGFPISKVLDELVERGVSVVSCVSSRTKDGFLYRIQSQVNDPTYIDLSELKNRLSEIMEQN